MSYYIVIREKRNEDTPAVSEVVRSGYLSTVTNSWINALFQEITFQLMVLSSAFLYICFGVPLQYSLMSIPIVLLGTYIVIYLSLFMKSAQILYEKPTLNCWVAEAYEPYFFMKKPETCWYKIIQEDDIEMKVINKEGYHRKIIGTIAVMQHLQKEDWAWLFRLVVDQRYRRKGIGLKLVNVVKDWCKQNHFNSIELAISECQEGSRELFNNAGFEVKQMYHKKLFSSVVTLQMFQLMCEVRSTF
ncbi:probable N-acetyltransferase 14 [Diabrotica undecimpunctata]|uniref:probable N-acetyltransferase 14 n=1 Tax=Diabrotica undecimpunctata TaxID=50387 RepID=UPI003B6324F4